MKRAAIHLTTALLTFSIGLMADLNLRHSETPTGPPPIQAVTLQNRQPPAPGANRPAIRVDSYALDEPAKIVNIRFADDQSLSGDLIIEMENISSRTITFISFVLPIFDDCSLDKHPGGLRLSYGDGDFVIEHIPKRRIEPHQRVTLMFPRKLYEYSLNAQKGWNCPSSAASRLVLEGVNFSDGTLWSFSPAGEG
jgi:hypothetical protein